MNTANLYFSPFIHDPSEIGPTDRPAALEDILKRTLAEADRKASIDTASIAARLANTVDFGHPERLIALQTEIADYNIYISLASTLTRKAVSAVETLVKGQ